MAPGLLASSPVQNGHQCVYCNPVGSARWGPSSPSMLFVDSCVVHVLCMCSCVHMCFWGPGINLRCVFLNPSPPSNEVHGLKYIGGCAQACLQTPEQDAGSFLCLFLSDCLRQGLMEAKTLVFSEAGRPVSPQGLPDLLVSVLPPSLWPIFL